MKTNEDIYALPIDQYSRQKWASIIAEELREKGSVLKIIDVGGYKGKTALFQERDKVTICDLFDVNEEGYVKGDGNKLPFSDEEFDIVMSFDTYEHVPRQKRERFISELIRVSKEGVVLAAPFDTSKRSVSKAEVELNNYYVKLYNAEHRWLKEHIDYGISTRQEIESILTKKGVESTRLSSNNLNIWVIMQTIYLSIDLDTDLRGRVDDLNRIYNSNLENIDICQEDESYRQIYFFSKKRKNVIKIDRLIKKYQSKQDPYDVTQFVANAMSTWGIKYRDVQNHRKSLQGTVTELITENISVYNSLAKRVVSTKIRNHIKSRLKFLKSLKDSIAKERPS